MAKPKSISFICCLLAALVLTVWIGIELFLHHEEGGPQFDALIVSGYAAISSLGLSLLASPVMRVARWLNVRVSTLHLIAFRRSLGLLAFWLASVHLAVVVTQYLRGEWVSLLYNNFLNTGALTFMLLLVLTVSSFPSLCRRLGIRLWNELHMLVYAIAVMAGFHVALSAFAPTWVGITVLILLSTVFLIRLLPKRRKSAS